MKELFQRGLPYILTASFLGGLMFTLYYHDIVKGIPWAIIFGFAYSVGLIVGTITHVSRMKRIDPEVDVYLLEHNRTVKVERSYHETFELCKQALISLGQHKVKRADYEFGVIEAVTPRGRGRPGEIISFEMRPGSSSKQTRVRVTSQPIFPSDVVDYGKNLFNVKKIVFFLKPFTHPQDDQSTPPPGGFWSHLDRLVAESEVVIDRPKGTAHPRFPDLVYPLDYGYLDGTTAIDGGGVDVWVGSLGAEAGPPAAVICTVDLLKRDTEVKILLGCTGDEMQTALNFHNNGGPQRAMLVRREGGA